MCYQVSKVNDFMENVPKVSLLAIFSAVLENGCLN